MACKRIDPFAAVNSGHARFLQIEFFTFAPLLQWLGQSDAVQGNPILVRFIPIVASSSMPQANVPSYLKRGHGQAIYSPSINKISCSLEGILKCEPATSASGCITIGVGVGEGLTTVVDSGSSVGAFGFGLVPPRSPAFNYNLRAGDGPR